jgi:hypothetical protein
MVNPQRPLRDSYYFLTDVIKEIQTTRLNKSFADVFDDNDYPNFNNPRHVLAYASTITSEDTDTMVLMRLWLYYVLIHKARDLHPTMFVIPEDNFHD